MEGNAGHVILCNLKNKKIDLLCKILTKTKRNQRSINSNEFWNYDAPNSVFSDFTMKLSHVFVLIPLQKKQFSPSSSFYNPFLQAQLSIVLLH